MRRSVKIGRHKIGPGSPVFIVAEMSANHAGDLDRAVALVRAMRAAGADAVKLQTYTADTLTLNSSRECFRVGKGSPWEGWTLHELYREACTPWEWHWLLKAVAEEEGLEFFSSPFDETAVAFLEELGVCAYKIASFELVDIPLIREVAATGKPVIMSTGMASREEIADAVAAARKEGCADPVLLKCTSSYPASGSDMNLRTIPDMASRFETLVGLSDHCMTSDVAVAAVAVGACVIEKHFTLSRHIPSPDRAFSLEPQEFTEMVKAIRATEKAMGEVRYGPSPHEATSHRLRRSLFVVRDVEAGDELTRENVRSIRPADGLPPKCLQDVLGRRAVRDIACGTPLHSEDYL
jgi:N-acetylneuraminate synthase